MDLHDSRVTRLATNHREESLLDAGRATRDPMVSSDRCLARRHITVRVMYTASRQRSLHASYGVGAADHGRFVYLRHVRVVDARLGRFW